MRKLTVDTGVEEFRVNGGGVLRFNPADPGLYERFRGFCDELPGVVERAGGLGGEALLLQAAELDREVKTRLDGVFGPGNDVGAVFSGVSLLGVTAGGATVLENLLDALAPVMEESARAREKGIRERAEAARARAEADRKGRGAA